MVQYSGTRQNVSEENQLVELQHLFGAYANYHGLLFNPCQNYSSTNQNLSGRNVIVNRIMAFDFPCERCVAQNI